MNSIKDIIFLKTRLTRKQFFIRYIPVSVLKYFLLSGLISTYDIYGFSISLIILILLYFVLFVISYSLIINRLHDANIKKRFYLPAFFIIIYLIIMILKDQIVEYNSGMLPGLAAVGAIIAAILVISILKIYLIILCLFPSSPKDNKWGKSSRKSGSKK